MAAITGSTSIDWSTVSLTQVDFAAHLAQANTRDKELAAELNSGHWSLVSFSSTRIVVNLFSGGRITASGSGLGTSRFIIRSTSFFNPATGEILRTTGFIPAIGEPFVTSITYGTTSFSESFIGKVQPDPNGDTSAGPVTSLTAKIGAATVTFTGALTLVGDDNTVTLTGIVTGISVVSGANTIKMTGLAIDIDVIEAAFADDSLSSVNDLFSVVGNQLNGDALIAYTNKSGIGMSFFGGAGNDTITISGLNGDTLHGGDGDDNLAGGLGQDTVNGGAGNDQITMLVTAGNVDTLDGGADTDMLVLSGVVGGNGVVVVDLSAADQVVSIAGDATRDTQVQTGFEGVNGLLLGSAMTVIGSAGDNLIIGSKGSDTIDGGDGHDTLMGGAGNDTLTGGAGNDMLDGGLGSDTMTGGLGDDTYGIDSLLDVITELANEGTDTVQINRSMDLNLAPFTEIENVVLTGKAALKATGDSGNNSLTGNAGANTLMGGDGNDTLSGGLGNDKLDGGMGDDAMDGGAGNDTLIGGTGQDSAQYGGLLSEYVLGTVGGMLTVTDRNRLNGNDGIDLVTGIEQLHFADATLTVTRGEVKVGGSRQDSAAVAGLANGGYVVTWTSGDAPFSSGISAQRFTAQGERVGSPTRVNATTVGLQEDSAVAGLTNGGYVVTWTSSDVSFAADIYAQRYNAQGVRIGSQTRVNTATTGAQEDSAVAGLANGGYVVTWTSSDASFSADVYAQRYNAQGARVGGETLVNTTTDGSQGDSAVARLANGGYVVIWTSTTPNFSEGIYAQRYNAQGARVGGETLVNTTTDGSLSNSAVAGLADGGYVVTWRSVDQSFSTSIFAQRYDAQGDPVGGETLVNTTPVSSQSETSVAGLADGGYIVTWRYVDPVFSYSMYAQRYDAQGVPVGGETLVDTTSSPQSGGAVAGLANGGYVVTWRSEDELLISNAYAQPYDAQGEAVGGYIVTGTAGADQLTIGTHSLLTVDGAGGNDILTGGARADRLFGGDGNDSLTGGLGNDMLIGGLGDDYYVIGQGTDVLIEQLDEGLDTVASPFTYTLGDNFEDLQLIGNQAINGTGNELANVLVGNHKDNILSGMDGNDVLYGWAGKDQLYGGSGDDTYHVDLGYGQDLIEDSDGAADLLDFNAGISAADLVISQQANNLRIAIHNSTDRVTIQNWYTSTDNQIETIQSGNGLELVNTQVDQLIQAMAAFTANTGLSWDAAAGGAGTAQQQTDFQNIIAANWQ